MITALSYVGLTSPHMDEWDDFATAVLGVMPSRSQDRLKLRLDERSYRVDIHRGEEDGFGWVGWETDGPEGLRACRDRLVAAGVTVEEASPELIDQREVCDLLVFRDPAGIRHEISYGPLVASDAVMFSRPHHGFITGEFGLGHVAIGVPDFEASVAFQRDVLGFRLTDLLPGAFAFMRCNRRHHSVALMQWDRPMVHHLFVQVPDFEQVGQAMDRALERDLVTKTLGRHANDHLTSFYARTPSGWDIEIGFGGVLADDDWQTRRVGRPFSAWGHRAV